MKLQILCMISVTFAALLTACSSTPLVEQHLDLDKILNQINQSIQAAGTAGTTQAPPITSVRVDLQVGVTTEGDGKATRNLVVVSGDINHETLHHISLSFIPTPIAASATTSTVPPLPALTEAIQAIYQASTKTDSGFRLKNGSVQVQCTLKENAGVDASFLGLVPLQIDATASNQVLQTITLNFGEEDHRSSEDSQDMTTDKK